MTAFQREKAMITEVGTLALFDKDLKTTVVADASPVGLGAVLLQQYEGRSAGKSN